MTTNNLSYDKDVQNKLSAFITSGEIIVSPVALSDIDFLKTGFPWRDTFLFSTEEFRYHVDNNVFFNEITTRYNLENDVIVFRPYPITCAYHMSIDTCAEVLSELVQQRERVYIIDSCHSWCMDLRRYHGSLFEFAWPPHGKMTIKDVENREYLELPILWLDIRSVTGYDKEMVLEDNRRRWFSPINLKIEEPENPADILTEYFQDCMSHSSFIGIFTLDENNGVQPAPTITGEDFILAASYLICDLGSSYAAYTMTTLRELINDQNAKIFFEMLYDRYEEAEPFIKDLLRDFFFEIFQYGPLWGNEESVFASAFTKEQNAFFKTIFDRGYYTLSNTNGNLFTDGRKMIADSSETYSQ